MKIALCLHGLFDSQYDSSSTGLDGYEYIKKHILSKGDVDVFIHSWEVDKKEFIESIYKPKLSIFEEQKDFTTFIKERKLNTLINYPRPPQSVISHFYSVTEAMKLPFKINQNYDIVIKSRFDLGRINRKNSGPGLPNPYPVQCINFKTDIQSDKIYMANWNYFYMGPADMWFYGSPDIMSKFTTLYDFLLQEMKIDSPYHQFATQIENNSGDLSNSIAFYKWWMMNNGLWDNRINLDSVWE